MLRILFFLAPLLCLTGCGVKLPPVAPEHPPASSAVAPKLDCSPKDPDCDKTDPNYRPRGR